MRNLGYQFKNAIDQCFRPGADKFAEKRNGNNFPYQICSYKYRTNLINLGYMICKYLKDRYPEIKLINQIQVENMQNFLEYKTQTCSYRTIMQYYYSISKLQKICQKTYKTCSNIDWNVSSPSNNLKPRTLRILPMDVIDYKHIEEFLNSNSKPKSKANIGIQLAARFALRVSEISHLRVKDIDLNTKVLHIVDAKGGRSRDLKIDIPFDGQNNCEFLRNIILGKNSEDKIVDIKEDSINRFLSRIEAELGLRQKYASCKTGIHSIRKMRATQLYSFFRDSYGLNEIEAKDAVSKYLGHGRGRKEIADIYIFDD